MIGPAPWYVLTALLAAPPAAASPAAVPEMSGTCVTLRTDAAPTVARQTLALLDRFCLSLDRALGDLVSDSDRGGP